MRGYAAKEPIPSCPHNDAVACRYKERPCATCGWNPEVEKARLEKITRPRSRSKTPIK